MIKQVLPIVMLGTAFLATTGCKNTGTAGGGEYKKYKGVEYKLIKDAPGKNAAVGDIIEVNLRVILSTIGLTHSESLKIAENTNDEGLPLYSINCIF